jgi:heat-inducible transcriptional repressor
MHRPPRPSLAPAVSLSTSPFGPGLAPGLDDRGAAILRQLVELYVETGEPVGSRTLSRRLPHALSPATIRNVLADLEEAGLLFAPHTSAGRLPTDRGLRLFVDGLLQFGALPEEERDAIAARCAAGGRSLQDTLAEAGQMLSGLAGAAGLVVAPKSEAPLRHIEFVALGAGRALVVLVTADGQVGIAIPPGHRLTVQRSAKPVKLVRFGDVTFFTRLRHKLGWGGPPARDG